MKKYFLFVLFFLLFSVRPVIALGTDIFASDLNGDNIVNSFDLAFLLSNYGQTVSPWKTADIDFSTKVNSSDLSQLLSNFGKTVATGGAYRTGNYDNLFLQIGKTQAEIDQRMEQIIQQFLYGTDDIDPSTGKWGGQRLYYPVGTDQAIIKSPDSQDVLVEGLHSFLIYLVELNHKTEFDNLWRWAKAHMQYQTGEWKGYFAWKLDANGNILGSTNASGSEPFIATALLFASHRWGNNTGINYQAEALNIMNQMIHKEEYNGGVINGVRNIFTESQWGPICNFVAYYGAADHTGSSYPTAAFYRLWEMWDPDPANRAYWHRATVAAREFWHRVVNPVTGLMPERTEFSGVAIPQNGLIYYGHDNWFTHSNISIDYEWFQEDPWQKDETEKLINFFRTQVYLVNQVPKFDKFYDHYTLDGLQSASSIYGNNMGHVAAVGGSGIILNSQNARDFAKWLWDDLPQPTGQWRFSTGLLYMMGMMEASGKYRIW